MAHRSQEQQRKMMLEAEVERLKEQLKQAIMEKSKINSEYEKLSTICRSQRQQLQGIKQALASTTPRNKSSHSSPQTQHQVLLNNNSSSSDQNSWQTFPEDPKTPTLVTAGNSRNSHQNQSQCFDELRKNERNLTSQPPGWAAF